MNALSPWQQWISICCHYIVIHFSTALHQPGSSHDFLTTHKLCPVWSQTGCPVVTKTNLLIWPKWNSPAKTTSHTLKTSHTKQESEGSDKVWKWLQSWEAAEAQGHEAQSVDSHLETYRQERNKSFQTESKGKQGAYGRGTKAPRTFWKSCLHTTGFMKQNPLDPNGLPAVRSSLKVSLQQTEKLVFWMFLDSEKN